MTLSLPWTFSKDDPAGPDLENRLQDVFDVIAQNALDAGGRSIRVRTGIATVTWPGGASLCTELTVPHGLGSIPAVVHATVQANGQGEVIAAHAGAYTSTTFKVQAEFVKGFTPGAGSTLPVAWTAIG